MKQRDISRHESLKFIKSVVFYSQIISAILPTPSHFWVDAADFPELTLWEGTEKPADSFVVLREKKTIIDIIKIENVNTKSTILFLNLISFMIKLL